MEELIEYQAQTPAEVEKDLRMRLQNFTNLLNRDANSNDVKTNAFAGNSKYIPISFLEMKLDEMFFGLWQTKAFTTKTILNEIVGELELWVFHPTAQTWLCRVGAGGVQIQFKSKSDFTDIRNKIQKTLDKDYPHLKAQCFRNACLSLGKSFGRDLNREFEDEFIPIIKDSEEIRNELVIDFLADHFDELPQSEQKAKLPKLPELVKKTILNKSEVVEIKRILKERLK